jgi:hypothetical protein
VLPEAALAEVKHPTADDLARSPTFHFQRGIELYRTGQLAEAIAAYRQCLSLQPDFPHARYHLGVALGDAEAYDEAIRLLHQVIQAEPEHAEAYNSLGYLASLQRQPERARASFEQAIRLQPAYAQAHCNLGMTLLQLGDYPRGFAEYEWRWQTGQFTPFVCPHPKWDGHPIPDKTLLIHTEQVAGDTIQFARYLPLAAQRCGRLVLACPEDLMPLCATLPGIRQMRAPGTIDVQEFDAYLPLLSLPHVFGTTRATVPASVPYVDVMALRRRKGQGAVPTLPASPGTKVGMVWAGSQTHRRDRHRSCPLGEWLPVLRTPGVTFYSAQTGVPRQELAAVPSAVAVTDLHPWLGDWGDLALLLAQMDLVISVDTAVAHLAGALGMPVWTLLDYVPDWRWGLAGATTPWYPTMRLFRQPRPGEWGAVLHQVATALAEWQERGASGTCATGWEGHTPEVEAGSPTAPGASQSTLGSEPCSCLSAGGWCV